MEKLEIKHLKGYLGCGLKAQNSLGIYIMDYKTPDMNEPNNYISIRAMIDNEFAKPILYPLSYLTKFREDLGFVPCEYWNNLNTDIDFELHIRHLANDYRWLNCTYFGVIEKLQEWKFDIHGLIEKKLAIPVTDEFNPYFG